MTYQLRKPIRIIFDASPLLINKTGVAYYTERLVTHMAAQFGDDIELIGFYYNFLGRHSTAHFPKLPNLRFKPVTLIPSKIIYQLRRWGIELPVEYLAKTRGDFLLFPNFLSYPSLYKTPSAPVVHDLAYIDLPQYVSPKNGRDLTRFVPVAIKRSCFIITVSEFGKQRIMDHYGAAADDILVTPIPPAHHSNTLPSIRAKLRADAHVTKPYLLSLGTIDPRKNIVGLIDAYIHLPEKLRNQYSLVIVGRIERFAQAEAAKIEQAVKSGYDVIHMGYVSDDLKDALYADATLFVHASNYEGFGMPVLEAMDYGLACVLSDIAVFREVGGGAAVYFDHKSPLSAAIAIEKVLNNPALANELRTKAKKHVNIYSWRDVARGVMKKIKAELTSET